ncbi:hypothetical protein Slin15195_G110010 [Septoria linicola]|uniref:Uncharacterized protein n=1 Tax=Septoria linicola TaxID=215465 RepID=A0A9Q9AXD1_9PEZI|nr:hypothetical protein Slin14017_G108360 [Septoria linicola]USW57682.1 hypothetical protein Slin15195_G110010 [Septoria linicola]
MQNSFFALFIAILVLSVPSSAWQPMKGTFNLPVATFADVNCGNGTEPDKFAMKGPYSMVRDGVCFRHGGSSFPIGSFVYGHEWKGKKTAKAEKKNPVCSIEVYEHDFCGGERRDYEDEEKTEDDLPAFPIYVVNGATHPDRLRQCYSLGEVPKKGKSMLMTCKFVNDREFPNCRRKSVKDDAEKGLLRACFSRDLSDKAGTSDAEDWCKPNCGKGWPKPVHAPGYGPQCKDPIGNCKVD